jgi:hypothetical protein
MMVADCPWPICAMLCNIFNSCLWCLPLRELEYWPRFLFEGWVPLKILSETQVRKEVAIRRYSRRGNRKGYLVEEAMLWRCFVSFQNRERQNSGRRAFHAQPKTGKPYLHRPWKSTQRRLRIAVVRGCLAKRAPTPAGATLSQ